MAKNKKTNKSKILWVGVGLGVCFLIGIIFVSSIISVGEKVRTIHPYVEYAFYGVCALLLFFLIINPLRIILLSTSFSISSTLDEDGKKNYK